MKKAKKLLVTMLSVFAVTAGALGMTACDNGMFETQSSSSSQQVTENEFRQVYAMYVTYAEAQGQTPMSYEAWLMSIRGEKGDKGEDGVDGLTPYIGENGNWWIGDVDTGIRASGEKGEKGDQGEQGIQGVQGEDGKSAYQIWLDAGYTGTEKDFLAWLKGEAGAKGEKGDQGEQGVGIKKVEYDENGNLAITFTDGTTQTVEMPKQEIHTHEWDNVIILKESTLDSYGVKMYICACGEAKYEVVECCLEGLQYTLNNDGESYSVTGIGSCTDSVIVIAKEYNNKPVTEIGERAFYNCDALMSVEIPDSVTSIGNYAFECCSSLTSFTVDEANTAYQSIDGNLYTKDGKTLVQYAIGKTATEFVIPDSVTSIGDWAFYSCSSLTRVVIGDSVTSIGDGAFYGCSSLTSVVIGDGVTSIGKSAFYWCDSLTNVYYQGTTEAWDLITIASNNEYLTNATRYYYSETQPTEEGNYWHYDENGEVVVW